MEKSSFFNSIQASDGSYDREYLAEDFAKYFASFIGNGVFPNPSSNLQVISNNDMTISISIGKAFINGYYYENTTKLVKTIDVADGVLNRIDLVVLRLDFTNREIKVYIKKGTFASSPVAPSLQRDSDMYELGLAQVSINAGVTSISQSNITDLRLDSDYCGVVTDVVNTVDVTTLYNQYATQYREDIVKFNLTFDKWFNNVKGKLGEDQGTSLQNQVNLINTRVTASDEYNIENLIKNYRMLENLDGITRISQVSLALTDDYYKSGRVAKATVSGYNNYLDTGISYALVYLSDKMNLSKLSGEYIASVWVNPSTIELSQDGMDIVIGFIGTTDDNSYVISYSDKLDVTKREWQRLSLKFNVENLTQYKTIQFWLMHRNASADTSQDQIISGEMLFTLPSIYKVNDVKNYNNELQELKNIINNEAIQYDLCCDSTDVTKYNGDDTHFWYVVKGGFCYVHMDLDVINASVASKTIVDSLPSPMFEDKEYWGDIFARGTNTAYNLKLKLKKSTTSDAAVLAIDKANATGRYIGSFVYPVAE